MPQESLRPVEANALNLLESEHKKEMNEPETAEKTHRLSVEEE